MTYTYFYYIFSANLIPKLVFISRGEFRSILSSNTSRTKAEVKQSSTDHWLTLMDSLIQFYTFSRDYNGVSTPKVIKKLTINPDIHTQILQIANDKNKPLTAEINRVHEIIRSVCLFSTA